MGTCLDRHLSEQTLGKVRKYLGGEMRYFLLLKIVINKILSTNSIWILGKILLSWSGLCDLWRLRLLTQLYELFMNSVPWKKKMILGKWNDEYSLHECWDCEFESPSPWPRLFRWMNEVTSLVNSGMGLNVHNGLLTTEKQSIFSNGRVRWPYTV